MDRIFIYRCGTTSFSSLFQAATAKTCAARKRFTLTWRPCYSNRMQVLKHYKKKEKCKGLKGGKRQSQRTSSLVIQFKRNLNVLYSRANGEILNKKSEYIYIYSLCVLFNSKDDIRSQGDDDGSSIQHLPRIIHTFIDSINSLFFL